MSNRWWKQILFGVLAATIANAEPTEQREWTSAVGTKLNATALALEGGKVTLKTAAGKSIEIPVEKLSEEDRDFLTEHFRYKAPPAVAPEGLPHPLGETSGPVQASDQSSYLVYLPKTLAADVKAPMLFWTGFRVATPEQIEKFHRAAELTGCMIAASVESKNGSDTAATVEGSWAHTEACLKHIAENLPVDMTRVFFSGSSGGGASALYNAAQFDDCAGALPMAGYIPLRCKPNNKGFYYVTGGSTDYNRYLSAFAADSHGDRAVHRIHAGGHKTASKEIAQEGLIWLYTRELYANSKDRPAEIARFEDRFHAWLTTGESVAPHQSHFWTHHLINTCELNSPNLKRFSTLLAETAMDADNVRYVDAFHKLAEFSRESYSKLGADGGSMMSHTTPAIEKAGEELAAELDGVIGFGDIAKEVGQKTGK